MFYGLLPLSLYRENGHLMSVDGSPGDNFPIKRLPVFGLGHRLMAGGVGFGH